MGKSSSAPKSPDYAAQAVAQGAANKETAIASSQLNNPNVVNPYGTQTWTTPGSTKVFDQAGYDAAMAAYNQGLSQGGGGVSSVNPAFGGDSPLAGGGTSGSSGAYVAPPNRESFYTTTGGGDGRPTLTQTLSPEQQALYSQNLRTQGLLGGLGEQGAKSLQGVVGKALDFSGAPAAPSAGGARQDAYDAIMSRVNEETAAGKDQKNSQLIAAGIRPGTKAYQDAMFAIDRGANDARQQAITAAGAEGQRDFSMGTEARKNSIAELLAQRQTPLNEINALMSGSQVTNPFAMPGASQNANIQPAPIYNAALQQGQYDTDAYNQQQANNNSTMSGLFGLGGAALQGGLFSGLGGGGIGSIAGAAAFSDARLKSKIRRIGTHPIGVGIYRYEIFGEPDVGVMAQELLTVKPEAVSIHSSGFYQVDYGRL
jgi:hypothetical protein